MNQDPALIGRVSFDAAIEFLQMRLCQFGEDPPLQRARALAGNYFQQSDFLGNRSEYGAANGVVDVAIASEGGGADPPSGSRAQTPPEFEGAT